jgi:hypothetical protein
MISLSFKHPFEAHGFHARIIEGTLGSQNYSSIVSLSYVGSMISYHSNINLKSSDFV